MYCNNQPDLLPGIFITEQIGQSLPIFGSIIALQVQVFGEDVVGAYAARCYYGPKSRVGLSVSWKTVLP